MLVYVPMIAWSVMFAWIAKYTKHTQRGIAIGGACLAPIIMAALRYNNGADYLMYLRMMEIYAQEGSRITSFNSVKTTEFGFYGLLKFCDIFFNNQYFMMFGVIAAIICGFFYAAIWKQSENTVMSVFLFFASGIYFDTYNGLRQYIAVVIVIYAFKYIYEREFKKYCLLILLASTFHYSALLMIPVYFVQNIKIDLKKACIVIIGCLVGGEILYQVVSYILQFTRYKYFLTSIEYELMPTQASILYVTIISLLTFGYITAYKMKISDKLQVMMNIQMLVWVSTVLSLSIPLAWRVQYYFLPFEIIFIPCFLSEMKKKNAKIFFGVGISLMYTIITLYGIFQNDWYDCIPYNFYFDFM